MSNFSAMTPVISLLLLSVAAQVFADSVEVCGQMSTTAIFDDHFTVQIPPGVGSITATIPLPQNAREFGYQQATGDELISSSRSPSSVSDVKDELGNQYRVEVFDNPQPGALDFDLKISSAKISVDLTDPFPASAISDTDMQSVPALFLKRTDKVQSDDPIIQELAQQLKSGTDDEGEVTRRIQQWLQQNITYSRDAYNYPDDALWVLKHRVALCDGWAHLFLALSRAEKIPARFVGGYNLGGNITYPIGSDGTTLSISSNNEPHAWVEVWFQKVGWVPYEPQASAGFVDSHHLKSWVGADSDATPAFLQWTCSRNYNSQIPIQEEQYPAELTDKITISCVPVDQSSPEFTELTRAHSTAQTASSL